MLKAQVDAGKMTQAQADKLLEDAQEDDTGALDDLLCHQKGRVRKGTNRLGKQILLLVFHELMLVSVVHDHSSCGMHVHARCKYFADTHFVRVASLRVY
jgi:hypothetical protein